MTPELIKSGLLAETAHGFFTRKGGVSSGVFSSLNCGLGSADDPENVLKNRALAVGAIGKPADSLATVHQRHSSDAVVVDEPFQNGAKADGMATAAPGVALGILTADCMPVLFHDPVNQVIGAAHAGWKGALAGVLESTFKAMEALGARAETTSAAIGPCISQRAYEVGPEYFESFMAQDPEFSRFFANGRGDRMQFDLPGFGLMRLRSMNLKSAEWTGHCTHSDDGRFFSYRRSSGSGLEDYGRLISVITL